MYPINNASPERIAVGAIYLIADGTIQTADALVRVMPQGGAAGAGGGTLACDTTSGIWHYIPSQAETNYTSFMVLVYKASCTSACVTVVTTASATPGTTSVASIASGAITADAIAADAITSAKIADDAIGDDHWNVTSVTATLANGAITNASLAGNMEIVFETDFATNYNTTRDKWQTETNVEQWNGNDVANLPANFDAFAIDVNGRIDLGKWLGGAPLALTSQYVQSSGRVETGGITTASFAAGAINAAAIADAAIDAATFNADVDAEVRSWLGLTSANLNTQLVDIDTEVDSIKAALVLGQTTIAAAGRSTTTVRLVAGSDQNEAYTGMMVVLDSDEGAGVFVARAITAYDGATKQITFSPAIIHDPVEGGAIYITASQPQIQAILADTGTDGVVVAAASKTGYSLTATTGLGNQTANITGNLSGSVGSVTGAVGSVTGAVGSVTGNVGGTVAGVAGTTQTLDALQTALNSAHGSGSWATATSVTVSDKTGFSLADTLSDAVIADAVWNALTASYGSANTYGAAVEALSSAADPWLTALPGAYGAGTAGYIIGTYLSTLYTDWIDGGRLDLLLDAVTGGASIDITTETIIIESDTE